MTKAFGRTFLHLDEEMLSELRTLEFDGTITSHQFVAELDDFALVRFRLTPAEIVRYIDGACAIEEWRDGLSRGLDSNEALALVTNEQVRIEAATYAMTRPDVGLCPAAFLGEELEDLLCFHTGERRQVVGTGYERDRRRLVEEIIEALSAAVDHLSREGRSGLSAIEFLNEEQIRDVLFVMLRGVFPDVTTEDPVSKYAGSGKRVDISIPAISTLIELKFARRQNMSHLAGQLQVDIGSYHLHRSCETLICVVWDPGRLVDDRDAIMRDLSGSHRKDDAQFVVKVRFVP